MTTAESLARFIVATPHSEVPEYVRTLSKMVAVSTVASAAAGYNLRSAEIIRDLAIERAGRPDASIWFSSSARLPVAGVAQTNALASDAAASDDTDPRNILHAGTPSSATSLAVAEWLDKSGKEVVTAVAIAYQVAARVTAAISPGFRDRGFHACIGAAFAATAATARLAALDERSTAHALCLCATSVGGLIAAADTSWSREYHAGLATQQGVNAALAAMRGYEGELSIFETPRGFFETFGGTPGEQASDSTLEDIHSTWDMVRDLAIKLAPGGHAYHAVAEAAAVAAAGISPDDVVAIVVARPGVMAVTGPRHPQDLVGMAHSPAFFAAAGVADGGVTWRHATHDKITDPRIHRLTDLVEAADPAIIDDVDRYRMGASVTVRSRDGRVGSATVYSPKGSADRGIDWADVDEKYRALLGELGIGKSRVEATLELLHRLDELEQSRAVTALLSRRSP